MFRKISIAVLGAGIIVSSSSCGSGSRYDSYLYDGYYRNNSYYSNPYPVLPNNYPYPAYNYSSYSYPHGSNYPYGSNYYQYGSTYPPYNSGYTNYYNNPYSNQYYSTYGVPITVRPYNYQYNYGYNQYSSWPSRYALGSYLECRTHGSVRTYSHNYRCSFPNGSSIYEYVGRHLDDAMEQFYLGKRDRGSSYLTLAMEKLPVDDPMTRNLEAIQRDASDMAASELQRRTMRALGDVAMKMSTQ